MTYVNLRHQTNFKALKRATRQTPHLKNVGVIHLGPANKVAWSRSRRPKLRTRKMFWTLVLALLIAIGALVVATGFLRMLLQSLSHEVPGI